MTDPDPLEKALMRASLPPKAPPGLGRLIAWTGRLGWGLVLPIVGGALIGRLIDQAIGHGVTFSAGLIFLGAVIGFRLMWLELRGASK